MQVRVRGDGCNLISICGFPAETPRDPTVLLDISHQTGNNKGLKG